MVGRAGATRVMFSDAISEPSISPEKTARTARLTPCGAASVSTERVATAVTGSVYGCVDVERPDQAKPLTHDERLVGDGLAAPEQLVRGTPVGHGVEQPSSSR